MANSKIIVPFILKAEGGYVNDPQDQGGETNKGITISQWNAVFGSDCHDRFMAMSSEDWNLVFKKYYWDAVLGDEIQSQRIANFVSDWCFNAGKFYPSSGVQDILIHAFGAHLVEDGNFGAQTVSAINTVKEEDLYNDIIQKRLDFYDKCVALHPTNIKFLQGWKNRVANLVAFNKTLA